MQVRLIPMSIDGGSLDVNNVSEVQNEFFLNYLKRNKANYRFITGLNANDKDLILFQLNGNVIASAVLKSIIYYNEITSDGYRGEYSFYPETINIFKPISAEELKHFCPEFKGFNQSKKYLNVTDFRGLMDRITTNEQLINAELLTRLNVNINEISDYKVRFLVQTKDGTNPLELYKENKKVNDWIGWKYNQDILNRPKVICFIKNYDLNKNIWLYVGTYEVSKKDNFDSLNNCVAYNLKLCGNTADIGILNVEYKNEAQQLIRKLENIGNEMKIADLSQNLLIYNEKRVADKLDWIKVLENEEIIGSKKILDILKFIYMSDNHMTTCGKIAKDMNEDVNEINHIISSFGKRVLDLLDLPENSVNKDYNIRWNIPFKTNFQLNKNGIFIWELRPELIEALQEKYDLKNEYDIKQNGLKLIRFKQYSRKDIHDVFSPNTKFTPQTGSWGLQGIIRVPDTLKDYIFLVTYGKSQSGHDFDENIDEHGILTWQSQPSQGFADSRIKDFINHDHLKNNIYLFLRTSSDKDYTYMGKLAYVVHDNQREKPVYFKWQILDWEINNNEKTELIEKIDDNLDIEQVDSNEFTLTIHNDIPSYQSIHRKGRITSEFSNRSYNFEGNADKNTKLGNKGEDVVVEYEKKHLISIGRIDLADQVMATRKFAGNAERFDVLSFEDDGTKKYIEVKTTTGGLNNPFHISENEVLFSEEYNEHYYLYRLYNFNKKDMKSDLIIIKGALNRTVLSPTNYICRLESLNKNI